MNFYEGKRIWITGASSGLGRELARLLLLRGAKLVLTARNRTALAALAAEGGDASVLPGDMENLGVLGGLASSAWETFDGLDMVVFNAGISHRSVFTETEAEVGTRILTVNLLSQIALTRDILPRMEAQGHGHIVSVTSLAGRVASPLRSYYSAAKHALHGLFNALRVETAGSGIRVSLVVPGFLKTDISRHALTGSGGAWNRSDRNQASGPDPVKAAVRVLRKLARGKREIYVGYPPRAALAFFLGTRFPALFERILRKTEHT